MRFKYLGKDKEGTPISGEIEAINIQEARGFLNSRGIYIIELKQIKKTAFIFKKLKISELIFLSRQISLLLRSGVTIVMALEIIEENIKNRTLKNLIRKIREYILSGESFSESLSHFKETIPTLFIEVVRVGESTGNLDEVLFRMADFYEKDEDLRRKVKNALIYPQIVLTTILIAVIFLLTFVLPIFVNIYKSAGVILPLPTRILIGISNFLINFWWLIIPIFFLAYFLLKGFFSTEKGSEIIDRFKFNFPLIVGKIIRESIFLRISHTLETLIRSGLNLGDSFELLSKVSGNRVVEKSLLNVRDKILQGISISRAMYEEGVFPILFVRMVSVGESGGNLEEVLSEMERYFESELDNDIKKFIALLEPSLTIVLGLIVAFIAFSIYLPMFDMIKLIGK
ncbi:MAG: type II secretion system F family protein [Caldisericia bacterium]